MGDLGKVWVRFKGLMVRRTDAIFGRQDGGVWVRFGGLGDARAKIAEFAKSAKEEGGRLRMGTARMAAVGSFRSF